MRAALALGCRVHAESIFARKNYFYPDLPKGYQISQYDQPLATDGVDRASTGDGRSVTVGITRVHLEEDAGKSLHDGLPDSARATHLDFNRSGVPLIEIVTEPDLRSPPTPPRPSAACARFSSRSASTTATWRRAACAATPTSRSVPSGRDGIRGQDRAEEPELVPARAARARVRDRTATCRRAATAAPLGAGDPALRSGDRPHDGRCGPRKRPTTTATSRSRICRRSSLDAAWIEAIRARCRSCRKPAAALRRAVSSAGIRRRRPDAVDGARGLLRARRRGRRQSRRRPATG